MLGGLIWAGILLSGCSEPPQTPPSVDRIGPIAASVFQPNAQHYLADPRPFALAADMSTAEALESLGTHLIRSYFSSGNEKTAISFEIMAVHRFPVPHREYRLAVVNMIDPLEEAQQGFFQGSAGGQTTFYMIAATFLQPHIDPPLLDAMILLYNGNEFPEIDHVNFRGIVTSETIKPVVSSAIHRQKRSGSASAN